MHNPVRFTSDQNITDSMFFYPLFTPYSGNNARGGLNREDSALLTNSTVIKFTDKAKPALVNSLFIHDSQNSIKLINKPIANQLPQWLPLILLIYLLILAIARRISGNRIIQVIKAAFSTHYLNQLERDSDILKEANTFGFLLLFLLSAAITTMSVIDLLSGNNLAYTLSMLAIIMGGICAFSLLQVMLIITAGRIMNTISQSREHVLNNVILAETAGILTLPLSVSYLYSGYSALLYISMGIFSLMLFLRYLRILIIGISSKQYSLLYLFLYLCTLEILPVFLALKYAQNFA